MARHTKMTKKHEDAPQFLSRYATREERARHYIETRWHDQYNYYTQRADFNRVRHKRLQVFIAVVAVIVPVLLGFQGGITTQLNALSLSNRLNPQTVQLLIEFTVVLPAVLSGLVAAATALENVQKYGDNWRAFQTAADGLERERALFESGAGPYRASPNPFRLFVERSEDVVAQETGRFFARDQKEDGEEESPEEIMDELFQGGDTDADTESAPLTEGAARG